jgi:hypothetical protein
MTILVTRNAEPMNDVFVDMGDCCSRFHATHLPAMRATPAALVEAYERGASDS